MAVGRHRRGRRDSAALQVSQLPGPAQLTDKLTEAIRAGRHLLAGQLAGPGVTEQRPDIVAAELVGGFRDLVQQLRADRDTEVLRVVLGDLAPGVQLGRADVDRPEPARPQQRLVDQVEPVRGPDDQHRGLGPEAVELGEQLRHDGVARPGPAVVTSGALRGDRVELVEHHHAGRVAAGVGEQFPDLPLALADVLVGDLGPGHDHDGGRELARDRLGEQRLPRPRRAVEDESGRDQIGTQVLWEPGRPVDDLDRGLELVLDRLVPADRAPGHVRHLERA